MRYRFSQHAQDAISDRGLSLDEIDAILQSPEQVTIGKRGRKIYQSRGTFQSGRPYLIRAVVVESARPPIVTTVYLTTRVSRYWIAEAQSEAEDVSDTHIRLQEEPSHEDEL